MKIKFLGAANTVTGSNYLITTNKYKFLIDCGLFQGNDKIEKLNYEDFKFDPWEIDFLILSHSHIDHSGRIPKLVKEGFKNRIFCTRPTLDLCEIMLKDSGKIHEAEAEWENRKRTRVGLEMIQPLYTAEDAEISMQYFNPVPYGEIVTINKDIKLRFRDAGHLLGSAIVELWIREDDEEKKLVFSGDLGVKDRPLLRNPDYIEEADYLIIESTYGNRLHENAKERITRLVDIILETTKRGGNVIIPSFAVGRTQEIIYELNKYYDDKEKSKEFLNIPVYIDSPLAISATDIFKKNSDFFDTEAKDFILSGDDPLDFPNLQLTRSVIESKKINTSSEPKIIISASGMCDAGRIKHHLKHNLWKQSTSVIFIGYQAQGTLGREIQEGAKMVKIFNEDIIVNAQIHSIEGFSGHADMNDLINWLSHFKAKPKKAFVVHGEKESTEHFSNLIIERFGLEAIVPRLDEVHELV
ncbi:MAG: metallo-beta-lactamase family protein [Candidatus Petromonas sp.]|jgi:metallo-beta-lactamase family protein|nr:metallo-beta-lactamase family protein [Candidatus Petromonas sp.]